MHGSRMTPDELRASLGLSSIFGLRMLGMFAILPVFAFYAEGLPGGDDLTLVGVAIGIYGLTQAILQIPFGYWSDRYGRKPVIYAGLAVFAAGSFIAALGVHIYVVILGRLLQGAGAIAAPVMAMAADLTREENRAKSMAMIGSTIGATFALSLVFAPWLNGVIGVPGIFVMTGVLVLVSMGVVYGVVPDDPERGPHGHMPALRQFVATLRDPQLARLNLGTLALHSVLMAVFIAVPLELRRLGLPADQHWQVYLPVMLGSFVLMLPAVLGSGRSTRLKPIFVGTITALLVVQVLMPWGMNGVWAAALFLLAFFTAFNVLEALLPTLVSRTAAPGTRGVAIGAFTSLQFFGTFLGAAAGGFVYGRWGTAGIVALSAALIALWLTAALGTQVPAPSGAGAQP
jgi:MFS family permease